MKTVIATCVILHNLIIDHQCKHNIDGGISKMKCPAQTCETRATMIAEMKNQGQDHQLQHDLMTDRCAKWFALNEGNNSDTEDDESIADQLMDNKEQFY